MANKVKIAHKEIDQVGSDTLDLIRDAGKFNKWMYQTIKPFCKGKILEIGSGVGNISQFFLEDGDDIMLSDLRQGYCDRLKDNFSSYKTLQGIKLMDLTDPEFDIKFKNLFNSFDTIFALNVIEHIFDDKLAIKNCRKLLKNNGNLIVLVPSYQKLFNGIDKSLDHYRRYNKKTLSTLFIDNNLKIVHKRYFNFMGIFAWFFSGKLQKNDSIPAGQMRLYNILVPIFRIIDVLVFRAFGLSTIVVGKK
ncbi:MAG: class I SAM-dependent methyltransferase [Saprospiraceae bacterium]|nr:class I SAM-dependent methyltransferase [Saprospiraceae bacterium]